jgi:hypothetical protein
MRLSLERKLNIEPRRQSLHRDVILRTIEKVPLAALVPRIPFENVEMILVGAVQCL